LRDTAAYYYMAPPLFTCHYMLLIDIAAYYLFIYAATPSLHYVTPLVDY